MTESEAYTAGWAVCQNGEDGRFVNPFERNTKQAYAWDAGFLDCMESEEGEPADPAGAGFLP